MQVSHVNLGNNPNASQIAKNSSNSTTMMLNHLAWSNPSPKLGVVANWCAFVNAAVSSIATTTKRMTVQLRSLISAVPGVFVVGMGYDSKRLAGKTPRHLIRRTLS